MPCNTPPPPSGADDMESDVIDMQANEDVLEDDEEIIDLDEMDDDVNDDSVLTYSSHTDAVFCCSFDKTGHLAISGGQDEKAFVWDTNTGENKFECSGHTDSVIAASFNYDSSLVATAGMEGLVQVWNVETAAQIWNFEATEITWMHWHPTTNILFAGTGDGSCWKWSVPDGNVCDLFPGNGSAAACGLLFSNGSKCAVGYTDGCIRIWNTEDSSVLCSLTGKDSHSANVITMACNSDETLMVSGAEDGVAKLFKSTNCKVLHTWNCSDPSEGEKESVECVGFLKSHPLVATGTNAGNLRIFDVASNTQRTSINVNAPIVKLLCDDSSPFVYAATKGGVELYDCRSAELIRSWEGHALPILDLAISPTREKFMTASDDQTCKIFMI